MTRVTRRPLAADDIAEVWDHIAEDNLDAADRWIDRLEEQFGLLATQPLMGRARPELRPKLRSYPFGRYMIFYAPLADGNDVIRVPHGARDIDAVFDDRQ